MKVEEAANHQVSRRLPLHNREEPIMFISPTSPVPGFRVNPKPDVPGFRVEAGEPARNGFADAGGAGSADGGVTPSYVPGPGGDGSGHGWDKCTLIPGTEQFGFCLYRCPDGTVRRSHGISIFGCQPSIYRNDGLGL
jgi:hypothetical protein